MTSTPLVSRYLRSYRKLKWAFIFCMAVAVFSMAASLVLGAIYFTGKKNAQTKLHETLSKIERLETAEQKISQLPPLSKKMSWAETATLIENFAPLRDTLEELQLVPEGAAFDQVYAVAVKKETQSHLRHARIEAFGHLHHHAQAYDLVNQEMIWSGVLTLVFGILLPLALVAVLGKMLNALRLELQNSAIRIAKEWSETQAGMNGEAFRNFDFWFKTILVVNSELSRFSSHPAIQLTGELSELIKRELDRQNRPPHAA